MTSAPSLSRPGWWTRWSLRRDARRAAASVDRDTLTAGRERFAGWPEARDSKYWHLERQIGKNLFRAWRLGLDRPPAGLRVLDLGTGGGYFPFACRFYGHQAIGIDLDDSDGPSIHREIAGTLRVDRRPHRIAPLTPLPDLGGRFDLVTAFAVQFNNPAQGETWDVAEWRFLLADLAQRVLRSSGRFYLELVRDRSGRYCDPAVQGLFEAAGGRVDGREVFFPRLDPRPLGARTARVEEGA